MKLTSDSLAKIAPAMVKAQKSMGNAVKDSKNPFFKSKYADLNAVREAVLPAFNENGISVLQPTVYVEGRKFVQTILIHESGEFFSGLTEVLSQKEGDAQAQGSGISYARRYGLQSLANIGADDDDGESAVGRGKQTSVRSQVSTSASKEASGDLQDETKKAITDLSKAVNTVTGTKPAGGGFRRNKAVQQEDL